MAQTVQLRRIETAENEAERLLARRAHDHLVPPALGNCPNCGEPRPPHRVCPKCGFYRGRVAIEMKEEE